MAYPIPRVYLEIPSAADLGPSVSAIPELVGLAVRDCQAWGIGARLAPMPRAWQKIREEECDPPAQDDTRVPAALAPVVPLAGRIAEATRRLRRPSHPRQHS